MAIGDDAALGGMPVIPGSLPANELFIEDNRTRDCLANGPAFWKSGLVLTAPKAANARTALGIPETNTTVENGDTGTRIRLTFQSGSNRVKVRTGSTDRGDIAYVADVDGLRSDVNSGLSAANANANGRVSRSGDVVTGGLGVNGAFTNPFARANGVSSWVALGVNPGGQFGFQMSSRKFKKDIKDWAPDRQAILAMRLVEFHYKVAYADGDGTADHGLIAEELHDLGLEWLVAYDAEGAPVTVRYERIGLALLAVVQDHEDRILALEQSGE